MKVLPQRLWEPLPLAARVKVVHTDCMSHPEFAQLAGIICMGRVVVDSRRTAATNGRDVFYGEQFNMALNQKQLRYMALHENGHKSLRHCVEYREICRRYRRLANIAQDHVINLMIEECDPYFQFVERPTQTLCCDKRFTGMSWIEVLRILIKENPEDDGGSGGKGKGSGGGSAAGAEPLDEHLDGVDTLTAQELDKLAGEIDEALRQGRVLANKLRGSKGSGGGIDAAVAERRTPWREALREFIQTICSGHDNSRFCPPNKRLQPLGFIMPSHFSEAVGELIIACDTSGSMTGVYPVVFGEIANICQTVNPERVRVIWWDTAVCGDQEFTPENYADIAQLMKPEGGGGTTVSCVAEYVAAKNYKPVAVIYLTDGYIESDYITPAVPCLWGVVDNERFVPRTGSKIDINSLTI